MTTTLSKDRTSAYNFPMAVIQDISSIMALGIHSVNVKQFVATVNAIFNMRPEVVEIIQGTREIHKTGLQIISYRTRNICGDGGLAGSG